MAKLAGDSELNLDEGGELAVLDARASASVSFSLRNKVRKE